MMPVATIAALVAAYLLFRLVGLWFRARNAGAPVSFARIVRLSMMRLNPRPLIDAYGLAVAGGIDASFDDLVNHAVSGGRLQRAVLASVAAKKANVEFPFSMARAMDLTGRDVVDMVQDLIRAKREGDREAAESLDPNAIHAMIGKEGDVSVAVGPPGLVLIDGKRVNALCGAGYIKKGSKVRIVSAKDNMVVVEPVVKTSERTN